MARKFLTALDLAQNELQNARVQNLGTAPSTPVKGQLYYNSTGGNDTLYWWDGVTWQAAKATGGAFPGYGSVPAETTFGIAKNDGVATTTARSDHTHGSPTHDAAAHSTIPLSALATATANINMGGFRVTNTIDPTANTDAATKQYVDNLVNGLAWSDTVRAATTTNITLSATQTIDGVAVAVNDRVLVKNQSTASANGIYIVQSGAWTRATDADSEAELVNMAVFVSEGTTLADTAWTCTTNAPITVGSTNITWAQFAGPGTVIGGAGLSLTGNTLDVGAGTGITVAADTVAFDTTFGDGRYATLGSAAKRYATDVGGSTSQVITHNLSTLDVIIQVYRKASPFDQVECDVEHTSTSTATLRFAVAPAAAEYRVVVLA